MRANELAWGQQVGFTAQRVGAVRTALQEPAIERRTSGCSRYRLRTSRAAVGRHLCVYSLLLSPRLLRLTYPLPSAISHVPCAHSDHRRPMLRMPKASRRSSATPRPFCHRGWHTHPSPGYEDDPACRSVITSAAPALARPVQASVAFSSSREKAVRQCPRRRCRQCTPALGTP